jgi:hypothetical protein
MDVFNFVSVMIDTDYNLANTVINDNSAKTAKCSYLIFYIYLLIMK